jgi:hypothetical protein
LEVVTAESGSWTVRGGDDDPVELLLVEEVVERVAVGAAASDASLYFASIPSAAALCSIAPNRGIPSIDAAGT